MNIMKVTLDETTNQINIPLWSLVKFWSISIAICSLIIFTISFFLGILAQIFVAL